MSIRSFLKIVFTIFAIHGNAQAETNAKTVNATKCILQDGNSGVLVKDKCVVDLKKLKEPTPPTVNCTSDDDKSANLSETSNASMQKSEKVQFTRCAGGLTGKTKIILTK